MHYLISSFLFLQQQQQLYCTVLNAAEELHNISSLRVLKMALNSLEHAIVVFKYSQLSKNSCFYKIQGIDRN